MYVEDAIELFYKEMLGRTPLAQIMVHDKWTSDFITSLYSSVKAGKTLSTEQGRVFLKALNKHQSWFDASVTKLIESPYYRNSPYQTKNIPNEVRYLGGNYLGFRYKKSDSLRADFKKISDRTPRIKNSRAVKSPDLKYHALLRIWVVSVTRENFKDIMMIIGKHDFKYDDAVLEYLALADNSIGQKSTFVVDPDTGNIIANICDNTILSSWINNVLFGNIA